jgi:2',3'-cyclic-nucleotide 2'-phosphodiesterase
LIEEIGLLFIGDVVGRPGLDFLKEHLKNYIEHYNANFVIVNGENVTNGKGITEEESEEIFSLGCNIITTGNHIWDNWKSKPLLAKNNHVLRPLNYPSGNAGKGYSIVKIDEETSVAVLQLQGRTYMQPIDCPFRSADFALKNISEQTNIIFIDFHAEATAEKIALGWYLDGKVSAIVGTHTHIQSADAQILPNGTAYITDSGMTGPYDSVVGMQKEIALKRFLLQTAQKFEMAKDSLKICGVFIRIDKLSGKALEIEPFIFPEFNKTKM